ncbi:hypothetical protein KSS87_005698 [Heliosperma pusillum]|nr:hypothetical protein KSS87_005698 [Heliosperma pusillum]
MTVAVVEGNATLGFQNLQLESVIRARIPDVASLISRSIDDIESELNILGRPIPIDGGAQLYTILELCRAFEQTFKEHLVGGRPGGDRIHVVFEHQLTAALRKIPMDRHLSVKNVKRVVYEADGYQPHLVAPELGYRRLIEGALTYFRGPAEASVDAVHIILKELVRKTIAGTQELRRLPALQSEIAAAAYEALEKFREESKKTTLRLVDMESSYINVDFFRKFPQEDLTGGIPATSPSGRFSEAHFQRIGSTVSSYVDMVSHTLKNSIPKAVVHCQVREAKQGLLNHFYTQLGSKEVNQLTELLAEHPELMAKREKCSKRLALCRSARDEIESILWTS